MAACLASAFCATAFSLTDQNRLNRVADLAPKSNLAPGRAKILFPCARIASRLTRRTPVFGLALDPNRKTVVLSLSMLLTDRHVAPKHGCLTRALYLCWVAPCGSAVRHKASQIIPAHRIFILVDDKCCHQDHARLAWLGGDWPCLLLTPPDSQLASAAHV